MRHKAVKVGLTTLVLSGALGGLLWTTLSEGTEYYKHVDEVMVNPAAWYGKPLQMHGYVVNAMRARNSLDYRFEVENNGAVVAAEYTGIVPDTFQDGADEVMVNPAAWYGKPLQMHGYVVNAMRARNSLDYRFEVENNGAVVAAEYTGIVPDTFQDGAEVTKKWAVRISVVIQGRLSPDVFTVRPNGIMAKCPSKYEPKPGTPAGPGQATSAGPT